MRYLAIGAALGVVCAAPLPSVAQCDREFDSTYELIQSAIFANKGCTAASCHGAGAAGGLDLRAGVSYDAMLDAPAESVPGFLRLVPGQKEQSLLWHNLAAATLPDEWQAPLRPMPIGVAPLSLDELEAVREWIESGAPRDGVVPGTAELLDACLPPAKPIEIEPLAPPPAGEGVQLRMPLWEVSPDGEDEVCFVSYYDFSDQVPAEFLSEDGSRFLYNRTQIRQDPLSHHLILNRYTGSTNNFLVRDFQCRGGDKDGMECDPMDLDFCGDAVCGSRVVSSFACIEFDGGAGAFSGGFAATQETAAEQQLLPGVYDTLPTRGWILWNSHAFNLTDTPGKVEAWVNFDFAEEQEFPARDIFTASTVFNVSVGAYAADEECSIYTLPPRSHLFELSSHTHKRGVRFQTFRGAFRCDGGSRNGRACAPFGPDTSVGAPDVCQGSPCRSVVPPAAGDCNGDLEVTINELIQAVNISLGLAPRFDCPRADPDGNRQVTVAELVVAVRANLEPQLRDPTESLLYTSLVYNDPAVTVFDPPIDMPSNEAVVESRQLTYCSLYDNGAGDPDTVKRNSLSPNSCFPSACAEGNVGASCRGSNHAACDTSPGAGDGMCDACSVSGGATTEDEMFILVGSFYID